MKPSKEIGKIRICALTLYPYDQAPGQRYRIEQWQPYLENEGITIDYYPFADSKLMNAIRKDGRLGAKIKHLSLALFRRIRHLTISSKYDVVFIYRASMMFGPALMERILYLLGRPIIFDFDDAIFLTHTSDENKMFGWAKFAGKTAAICRLSSSVTVGNSWLAEYARHHNKSTFVVPTSVDTNKYKYVNRNNVDSKKIVIGWTGSSTSQYHLEAFEPVLKKLLKRKDVEIRVVSDRKPSFTDIPFSWREWSLENEITEVNEMDIGIMPNPDDEWSRGKCAFKALQYMAVGTPAVCSNIGANRDVIEHGKNGYLANTDDEWIHYLEELIDNADKRLALGIEARKTVVEKYSMERSASMFADIVKKTVANVKR